LYGRGERVLGRLFGDVDVAAKADENGHGATSRAASLKPAEALRCE
jgi:hypothetical protein